MMEIHLTPAELMMAAHYAGLIEGVKSVQLKAGSIANRRICNQGDFAIHYIGMLGEIAVSRAIGTRINAEITVGGDGAVDMDLYGQTIQVKTSSHAKTPEPRFLIFNSTDDFATDWAVSCSVQSPTVVKVHGFVGKEKFLIRSVERDFGYGQRICLDEKYLSPIEKFREAVEWKRGM